ncbi:MAG: SRPBCC domain-containing protein [Steroidobacteraceae bacterium]
MTTHDVPVFVISRQFAASPERVYKAWADPAQLAQWSGPKGASVEIIQGSLAVGESTISRMASPGGPEMFSLNLWRELSPHRRVAWEQSFCTREGVKCAPPFFDDWPQTLLTEVDLEPRNGGTLLTLKWTPIEYTAAALAMFARQMASMTGGWGGSFDKLDEWLASHSVDRST